MDEQGQQALASQSVARLRQIRDNLRETDELERESLAELAKSPSNTPQRRLAVGSVFARARLELYNEQALVATYLLNSGAKMPATVDDSEVMAIASDVGLAAKLKQQRGQQPATGPKGVCDTCISVCVDCVSFCVQCVSSAGLSGCSLGSMQNAATAFSPCNPAGDIGNSPDTGEE